MIALIASAQLEQFWAVWMMACLRVAARPSPSFRPQGIDCLCLWLVRHNLYELPLPVRPYQQKNVVGQQFRFATRGNFSLS